MPTTFTDQLQIVNPHYADSTTFYQASIEDGWLLRVAQSTFDEVAQKRAELLNETPEASVAWLKYPECWIPYLSDPQSGVWICRDR
jgi:hypothetical protein